DLLTSTLSASVRRTFKVELSTRRLYTIWQKICEKCGPRCGTEGLSELDKKWTATTMLQGEDMMELLQRIDDTADAFEVYGTGWEKTDLHKIVLVRQALVSSKHGAEWKREIRDADRLGEGWDQLKTRLEKLAGEIRADAAVNRSGPIVQKSAEKANAAIEKKIAAETAAAGGLRGKESEEERIVRVASSACNLCTELGRFARDCPWKTKFREMKAEAVANSSKLAASGKAKAEAVRQAKDKAALLKLKDKPAAAVAKEEDSEDEVGCVACMEGDGSSELFDDWLDQGEAVADSAPASELSIVAREMTDSGPVQAVGECVEGVRETEAGMAVPSDGETEGITVVVAAADSVAPAGQPVG
ncbi:hypothetical protein B484DRAFT_440958, partial [Ochromonadaceae sp. CCMP2298]